MVQINIKALRAVSRFSGKQDIRYYLNGVYVQASPVETRLTATNGHALALYSGVQSDENTNGGYADVIIPLDAVSAILKVKPYNKNMETVTLSNDNGQWKIEFCGNSVTFFPVDAKFPDYMRVIPREVSGEVAQYQVDILARCQDAACDFRGKKAPFISVKHNGNGAGLVDCGVERFVVVVMPWNDKNAAPVDTGFAFDPVAVAPVALRAVA